jgi:hypothetical protein
VPNQREATSAARLQRLPFFIQPNQSRVSGAWALLIKKLLEADKHLADLFRHTKIGHSIGDGVVIFQAEQRTQFCLIELIHTTADVMRQNKIEEHLLFCVKASIDDRPGLGSSFLASQRRQGVSHVGEHVEQITFLSIDDLLHFRQLVVAKSFFRKTL